MKKGFSQYGSNNSYSQNSQHQESSNGKQNELVKQNQDHNEKKQFKDPQNKNHSSFSAIKRQSSNFLLENENHLNRLSDYNQNMMDNNLSNNFNNSLRSKGNFSNFESINEANPYIQEGFNQFQGDTYSMLFNQFQNNVPQISADQAISEGMILQLFQIIESQAKSLENLFTKVAKMTEKINQFGQKMTQMKKVKKQIGNQDGQIKPVIEHLNQTMENIDAKTLIKILFGANKTYQYKLQLNQPLDLPLYRQRNFSISLRLIDSEGKTIKNSNKIPLSLAIYNSENPPKFIQKNTAGQRILKGYIEQSIHFGQCKFEKIQIKQVTSHFRNGWVYIVIIPSMTPLGGTNPSQTFIDYVKIQPLVLQKVIVKAKKIKQLGKKGKQEQKQQSQLLQNNSEIEKLSKKQSKISKKNQDEEFDESIYEQK